MKKKLSLGVIGGLTSTAQHLNHSIPEQEKAPKGASVEEQEKVCLASPIYVPRKHTVESYRSQQRRARKRNK